MHINAFSEMAGITTEELERLEHLNLVSRVITELENHFGLNSKEVAEFIIQLAKSAGNFDKFKKALEEHDLAEGVSKQK